MKHLLKANNELIETANVVNLKLNLLRWSLGFIIEWIKQIWNTGTAANNITVSAILHTWQSYLEVLKQEHLLVSFVLVHMYSIVYMYSIYDLVQPDLVL